MRRLFRVAIRAGEFVFDTWSMRRLFDIEGDAFILGGLKYLSAWSAVLAAMVRDISVALVSENDSQQTRLTPAVR